jgi:putative tributyrin esterase
LPYHRPMALLHVNWYSETLKLSVSMSAILPRQESFSDRKPYRTLFLLHGLSDDHTIWCRRTSIERYADERGIAVVMPAVERSFYTDMARGLPWWTFVSRELPAAARFYFPLSEKREDTWVAGLSMGGYGAFKLALTLPGEYAAAGSFSGALHMADPPRAEQDPAWKAELENIFGDLGKIKGSGNDLFALAEAVPAAERKRLRLYQCCGTEDFLIGANRAFRQHATLQGLDLTYGEDPGEDHTWKYWDRKVQDFLKWLLD